MLDILFWIIGAALVLIVLGTPVLLFFQVIAAFVKYFLSDWYNRHLFFTSPDPISVQFLERNFRYYQQLSNRDQQTFAKRVQKFIRMKTFESREDLYITIEMETLVAAAAIQITFGFPSVYLEHFDRIILYPDVYHSTITDSYHRGEVNSRGVIVLSWKNLLEGYSDQSDGRNLGLHEMAHALKLSDAALNVGNGFFDERAFYKFIGYGREEMHAIASGSQSFFRNYAASNDQEFFAVATENFFERPHEFRQLHQVLFATMVDLLNQDPTKLAVKNFQEVSS
jgi:MtfA peptidase